MRAFNARGSAARLAGTRWSLLLPPSAYTEQDAASYENGGKDITFPHQLPGASKIAEQLQAYPWMDSLTLAFALEGARLLDLGHHGAPDLLLVSLSTTDAVGHRYGPDSREIHDQILRLDRWLGWFLDSLAKQVPRTQTLVVLTSDHGVQSYPERVPGKGRVWLGDMVGRGERFGGGLLSADTSALAAAGLRVDSVARRCRGRRSETRHRAGLHPGDSGGRFSDRYGRHTYGGTRSPKGTRGCSPRCSSRALSGQLPTPVRRNTGAPRRRT